MPSTGPLEFLATLEFSNFQREALAPAVLSMAINGSATSQWQEVGREVVLEVAGRTEDQVTLRMELVRLQLTAPLQAGDVVTLSGASATPEGPLANSASTIILGTVANAGSPELCVTAFLVALGTTKGPDGRVTFSSSISCATIRSAAASLQECLTQPSNNPSPGELTCTMPNGDVLTVVIDSHGNSGGNSSSITGSANVVISLGGNATASSTSDGGSARAVNTRAGGASIAIGGLGGHHQAGSPPGQPGDGGAATASSTAGGNSPAGDSIAIGGHGGNGPGAGGDGGHGTASTNGPKSLAYSQGGDGGDPANSPGTTNPPTPGPAGGKGGNATSKRDTQPVEALGAGQPHGVSPIPPGKHGGGAQATATLSGVAGTNGALIANT